MRSGGGQWEDGGVAILSPHHVKNGSRLIVEAREAASDLERLLRGALEKEG